MNCLLAKIEAKLSAGESYLVMAVGDSITYGRNHCTDEETYLACLARAFAVRYPRARVLRYDGVPDGEMKPLAGYAGPVVVQEGTAGELVFVRCGVGGNTVRRALSRAGDYTGRFLTGQEPDLFLLMFGINDALSEDPRKFITPERFYEDQREMHALLKETDPDADIVLMTATYNDPGEQQGSRLDPYTEMTKRLAAETGSYLIDTHALWMAHYQPGTERHGQREWLSAEPSDMCHFSPEGSRATAMFIFDALTE